jgi:hypothetical protein
VSPTVTGGGNWKASGSRAGTPFLEERPTGYTGNMLNLMSVKGAYLLSPSLAEGVGTVYFVSCMRNYYYMGTVEVQITTNAAPSSSGWETVSVINYPQDFTAPIEQRSTPVTVNRRDARYVRFVRTDANVLDSDPYLLRGSIGFDEVRISYPPADVAISERLRNPGYPASDQDVKIRCVVADVDANFPAVNRQVKCYYSWQNATLPFVSNVVMTAQGNNLYEGTIPRHDPGTLSYYFRCDFDGYFFSWDPDGAGSQPTRVENQSPAFLPDGVSAPSSVLSYEIRRYRSMFDNVMVDANPASLTVPTELVGNNTWQGITLVKGITNMTWRFMGYAAYTNNATAFDPIPYNWGDNDQDFPFPPIAGYVERPATNSMRAILEYEGFLLFRVNTDPAKRDYIVKRAVYQNFDNWQASQYYFEESLGLYAVKSFTNNFNFWVSDTYPIGDQRSNDFELLAGSVGQANVTMPTMAPPGFAYVDGKAIAERTHIAPNLLANTALSLSADSVGRVWNTSAGFTPGIDSFTFTGRASVDDPYFALYKGSVSDSPFTGANWLGNYVVTTTLRARETSRAPAYISVMTYYQPTYFGGGLGSFYEVRFVQASDPDAGFSDNRLEVQVWRWNDGVSTPVRVARTSGTDNIDGQKLASLTSKSFEITVDKTTVASKTRVQVKYDLAGGAIWNANVIQFDDASTSRLTAGGSVGFMTFDAVPEINSLAVKTAPGGATMLATLTSWSGANGDLWFFGGKRRDNPSLNRWQADSGSGALVRLLPTLAIGVYTAPAADNSSMPNFEALTPRVQRSVATLTNCAFTVSLKEWNKMFVELRNGATNAAATLNDLPFVVDNPTLTPWRAKTRATAVPGDAPSVDGVNYRDWTSWDTQQYVWLNGQYGWGVLEGWVTTSSGSAGNEVTFERSRANPGLVQALVSPVLTNGIGSIAFDHRASNGKIVFAVERTVEGAQSSYVTLQVVTNSSGTSTPYFLTVRELFTGRIRVRVLPASDKYAVLKIDNLLVRDYPPRDETTWQAYNSLITSKQTDRAFEPTKTTAQTAFLNNSVSKDTAGAEVLSEYQPFIQSPKVGTGIGEIAFWYRAWDATNGLGRIMLKVAPELDTPENEWIAITNFSFSNTSYQYFSMEPYDLVNKVLRIYTFTNNSNRVAIDNALMTEPVRAGYEIRSVRLVPTLRSADQIAIAPTQPLENQSVDVEVEIGRFIMNPTGIRIFVSYHADSDVWGYTNWWTQSDAAGSHKIELQQDPLSPRLYRTTSSVRIPALAVDTPVQYMAWGTHDTLVGSPIFQGTNTFTHPSWYFPRNLNTQYATQGWSPYYFVYSCLPGAVWVNEINYKLFTYEGTNEYVELAGPSGTSIAGWRIESINNSTYAVVDSCTVDAGFRLADTLDGWGFFIWGDPGVPNVNKAFTVPGAQNLLASGGIRLVRSMGAWEYRLCYGSSGRGMTNNFYQYIGFKPSYFPSRSAPLHLIAAVAGNSYGDFYWSSPSAGNYTPGTANAGQGFEPNLPTFFTVFSVIGPNGTHSVSASPVTSFQVVSGGSTSIVYNAANWFRIATCRTNGVSVASAIGQTTYLWSINNIQSDCSNNVTFVAATPEQTGVGVPTAWASAYYATEAAALADTNIATDYLLGLDPTVTYAVELMVDSITVNGTSITVVVQLKDGVDPLDTTINGTLKLQGKVSLSDVSWSPIGAATILNANFGADGKYSIPFTDATYRFYQAVITP